MTEKQTEVSRERVRELLREADRPVTRRQLSHVLGLDKAQSDLQLKPVLTAMLADGEIIRNRRAAYGLPDQMDLVRGRISAHPDGYGFVVPDDGGEDVFVHQNNINMEGFRYLKPGEHVSYELEVGEKGLKAVQVTLLDEREPGDAPFERNGSQEDRYEDRRPANRPQRQRPPQRASGGDDRLREEVDKLRRKQERLISLLVEKDVLAPDELDRLAGGSPLAAQFGEETADE